MADLPKSNTGTLGIPPGGPWFVFPLTGTIQRQSEPVLAEALVAAGWVGYAKKADAETVAHTASLPAQAGSAKAAVTGAITDTGDFLSRLTSPALWIRIAEIALGLLLIGVGIAKLTNAIPAATKAAKGAAKIGEVAALA